MEREEKGRESNGEEEEEFMGLKLKRSILVGKRGGPCTPPPTWNTQTLHTSTTARQLGANLWEILPHLHSLSNMNNPSSSSAPLRRHHTRRLDHHLQAPPHSDHLPDQPGSTGSFHRQIAETVRRHHRSVEKNGRAVQPVSPASFGSSMELTEYNPEATPSSSLELKGRSGLKTSTELLKVLNRIWTLEEQHSSNVSLVKALKTELDNSTTRIKELLKEKQVDRQVIEDLMKQLLEGKLPRKNMEQERIKKSTIQSIREELEDERKLRKRSESLHNKLARELADMKSSFSKAMNELERERRARVLLEELCDEFAIGIRDYEQEMRSIQYKTEKDQTGGREHVDSLIVHMSEAWLDERAQMKLGEESDNKNEGMVVEKLSSEIETFLIAREQSFPNKQETKQQHHSNIRRRSLESYHLNEATSAPKNADDDESSDSESNCFELSKALNEFEGVPKNLEAKPESGMSRLQARFQEHMIRATSSNGKSKRFGSRSCLARNNSSSVEGDRIHPEDALVGPTSPVKNWEPKIELQDPEVKENTLKARLLEARQWHAHSKATKG